MKRIKSIQEYLDYIFQLTNSSEKIFFYRGHANKKYKNISGIERNNKINESQLCKKIVREYPKPFGGKNRLETLIIMQHYGFPTRLLDFSLNPLVALYFAVTDLDDDDGKIIIYFLDEKYISYEGSTKVKVLALFSKYEKEHELKIKKELDNYINYTAREVFEISKKNKNKILIEYFNTLIYEHINLNFKIKNIYDSHMFLTNKDFLRASNQDSAFYISGLGKITKHISHDSIIIPHEYKLEIRKQLKWLGIKDSTMYPSLESIGKDFFNKKKRWVNY